MNQTGLLLCGFDTIHYFQAGFSTWERLHKIMLELTVPKEIVMLGSLGVLFFVICTSLIVKLFHYNVRAWNCLLSSWHQKLLVTAQVPPLGVGCLVMEPRGTQMKGCYYFINKILLNILEVTRILCHLIRTKIRDQTFLYCLVQCLVLQRPFMLLMIMVVIIQKQFLPTCVYHSKRVFFLSSLGRTLFLQS